MTTLRPLMIALALALPAAGACQAAPGETAVQAAPTLASAIAATHRSEANRARDGARHPAETLAFFGVDPGDTVVEIWPGGGWYAEILAPYLAAGGGTYIAAAAGDRGLNGVRKLAAAEPELFGKVTTATFPVLAAASLRTPLRPRSPAAAAT